MHYLAYILDLSDVTHCRNFSRIWFVAITFPVCPSLEYSPSLTIERQSTIIANRHGLALSVYGFICSSLVLNVAVDSAIC